jgi:hypothetical protein
VLNSYPTSPSDSLRPHSLLPARALLDLWSLYSAWHIWTTPSTAAARYRESRSLAGNQHSLRQPAAVHTLKIPTHLLFNLQVVDLLLQPSEVGTGRLLKPLRSLQDLRHEPCPLQTLMILSIKDEKSRLPKSLLMHLIAASITIDHRGRLHLAQR